MEFESICDILKEAGEVRAKKMFGTYNICLDGINLGVICEDKWLLKKTAAGDDYLNERGTTLATGIKGTTYAINDLSDTELICELARVTRDALKIRKEAAI